jgi:hypothetical protein
MATKEEMKEFAKAIEKIVADTNYTYYEAIVEYCNTTGLEVEVAATLVNNSLKEKIEMDAQDHNLLPKSARLPF